MKTKVKIQLKKHLTDKEIKSLEKSIFKHFKNNARFDRFDKMVKLNSITEMNDFLGLAYTSSSSFAMLSICNTEVYLDVEEKYTYVCFGNATATNWSIALLHDENENELYIRI